jgi:hypothetical protein
MNEALETWRKKLEYLQHQEAIVSDPAQKFTLAEQIEEAKARIAELEATTEGQSFSGPGSFHADISRIIKYAPAELIGREDETKLLSDAWDKAVRGQVKRPHVLTIVALGGEGKTSLVANWAADLAHQDWPGCDAVFAWSFYSQGTRDQALASSDTFLKEALTFFGNDEDKQFAGSNAGGWEKGGRLARIIGQRRSLLILDGLEPLQYAPTSPTPGELKDQGLAALLKGLAAASHGLCIVTTRYSIPDLRAYWQTTAPEVILTRLSSAAGVALLRSIGVKGTQKEFEALVEDVKGHALTLNLLGTYLRDAYAGDIRKRDRVKLAEADAEEQGGHAFCVMDAYVKALEGTSSPSLHGGEGAQRAGEGETGKRALALLRLLGLFDRHATADCLEALWQAPAITGLTEPLIAVSEAQRNMALTRLEAAKLLTANRDTAGRLLSLDAHPMLREYFARQLRNQGRAGSPQPAADDPAHPASRRRAVGSAPYREAHRRLYEHLCATTKEGDQPTLEDLQPLYQAVAHGCQAGLQQEAHDKVWFNRIRRGNDYYSMKKLGAYGSDLGALACFFEAPWSRVSSSLKEYDRAVVLNAAAVRLRALGRLTEALEPMRVGLEMGVKAEDWCAAARRANNLSDLELTLGEMASAGGTRRALRDLRRPQRGCVSTDGRSREDRRRTTPDGPPRRGGDVLPRGRGPPPHLQGRLPAPQGGTRRRGRSRQAVAVTKPHRERSQAISGLHQLQPRFRPTPRTGARALRTPARGWHRDTTRPVRERLASAGLAALDARSTRCRRLRSRRLHRDLKAKG